MRILLTADPELPVPPQLYGGIERIIDSLAREMKRRGHVVGLVAHCDSTCDVDQLFAWPCGASQGFKNATRNALALSSAVRRFRPDVLHSFSRLMSMAAVLPTRLPKIMSYQRQPSRRTVAWASRLAGKSLQFTGCSQHIAASGREAGGQWHAIPNFVDLAKFASVTEVPPDAPLVFLSRIERIKGTHTAIAIAKAANRQLIIAGNRPNSDEARSYWTDEIEPHLGRYGIEYVGPVDDCQKNELLGSAAAMVVPIEWEEPFGIVFAESLACGTPVISTPRGSVPEIVEDGRTGFVIDSIRQGAEAVTQLPTIDRRVCREAAANRFSLSVVADQYEQLYSKLAVVNQ